MHMDLYSVHGTGYSACLMYVSARLCVLVCLFEMALGSINKFNQVHDFVFM